VARGLQYLHNNQLVHGDLKPANILINGDYRAELGDSGLLPLIQQDEFVGGKTITTSFTNSARYMAPELVHGEQSPTLETDIYALGCVGYEFLFSNPPYANITNEEPKAIYKIYRQIGGGTLPASRPNNLDNELSGLWDILEACWRDEPEERRKAPAIVEYLEQHCESIVDSFTP
jgi:serine/threonine protein kinase